MDDCFQDAAVKQQKLEQEFDSLPETIITAVVGAMQICRANKLKLFVLLTMYLLVSCSSVPASIDNQVLVKLKRTACHGECPVYEVVIKKNGDVEYEGAENVAIKGIQFSRVSMDAVALIEAELIRTKLLKMKANLNRGGWGCFLYRTDHSYIVIEAAVKNRLKAVSTYLGCDSKQVDVVADLADYIDKIATTSQWVKEK